MSILKKWYKNYNYVKLVITNWYYMLNDGFFIIDAEIQLNKKQNNNKQTIKAEQLNLFNQSEGTLL